MNRKNVVMLCTAILLVCSGSFINSVKALERLSVTVCSETNAFVYGSVDSDLYLSTGAIDNCNQKTKIVNIAPSLVKEWSDFPKVNVCNLKDVKIERTSVAKQITVRNAPIVSNCADVSKIRAIIINEPSDVAGCSDSSSRSKSNGNCNKKDVTANTPLSSDKNNNSADEDDKESAIPKVINICNSSSIDVKATFVSKDFAVNNAPIVSNCANVVAIRTLAIRGQKKESFCDKGVCVRTARSYVYFDTYCDIKNGNKISVGSCDRVK